MHPIFIIFLFTSSINLISQTKTTHVFIALCNNEHKGIALVPERTGSAREPPSNL